MYTGQYGLTNERKCGIVRLQNAAFLCSVMNLYLLQTTEHFTINESIPDLMLRALRIQIRLWKV